LLLIYFKIKKIKISKESEVKIDFLKKKGDRITVDLDDCEIITYNLKEDFSEVNNLDLSESYTMLNFEILYKDHTIYYSHYSEKDVETLKIHFVIKKTAILYVNPKNHKQNYIDLEFLNK
jgi:hypothetical protein